jgi:tight adherence protein C
MVKPLLAFPGAVVGYLFFAGGPSPQRFLIVVALTALCYFTPDLLVRNRAQKRREAIRLELPVALDHMLISVQAGLGFEAAMGRAGTNGSGPMAEELIRTLQDIQVGRSRKEAYLAMAERVDVPDVRSFIRAVVQAAAYGVAIASVLKAQAEDMRIKRKQRAEEHAMKMPVKMLFPLIFFILPTLFIVVLGPTVMTIVSLFAG